MKVAILTWFHYYNYGTALQVYALSQKITDMGHTVDIIDYRPDGKTVTRLKGNAFRYYLGKALKRRKNRNRRSYTNGERDGAFEGFYAERLHFTESCETFSDFRELNGKYDAFVCGSDQIWAPSCFDSRYFLDFVEDTRRMIAYAPSVGLPSIADTDVEREIKRLTSRFGFISTREYSGSRLLEKLIGREVQTVLDPTLLYTKEEWEETFALKEDVSSTPYLLAYFLGQNEKQWKQVAKLAKAKGLQLKIVPVFEADRRREGCISSPIGPKEFLTLLKNASFVCTDSFHGTIFSINFEKQFLTFERFPKSAENNQNSRIYNILGIVGLENRLAKYSGKIPAPLTPVDFATTKEGLALARKNSLSYLTAALEGVEKIDGKGQRAVVDGDFCCGCSACLQACPVAAVSIVEKNGFYTAQIDAEKCISCGKCRKVCPMFGCSKGKNSRESKVFSYKDYEEETLRKSSSGGAAHRIAKLYLEKGYTVVGCSFDVESQRARHVVVRPSEPEKLALLQGSKYMQSDFSAATAEISEGKEPLVVFGTPCQIAGAKKLAPAGREIVYVDLICHGVPSGKAYEKYCAHLQKRQKMDGEKLRVSFRDKRKGWHSRYICVADAKKEYLGAQSKDAYFRIFESGFAYCPTCYECRWRASSAADLRLGDYWGDKFAKDETGVSMLLSTTDVGDAIVETLKGFGKVEEQAVEDYFQWQQSKNFPRPVFYPALMQDLSEDTVDVEQVVKTYVLPVEKRRRFREGCAHLIKSVKRLIKRK